MAILKHIDFEEPGWASLTSGPLDRLSYRQQILADLPSGYWPLDETSGTTALDHSGNNRHGQYLPNVSGAWTGGTFGQTGPLYRPEVLCPSFNGTSGYVQLPANVADLSTSTSTLSVELWTRSTVSRLAFCAWNPSFQRVLLNLGLSDSSVWIGTTYGLATVTWNNNQWHHWVITITSGKTVRLYFNCQQVMSFTHALASGIAMPYVAIAAGGNTASTPTSYFSGRIACAAIYPQCLTADRVAAHYRTAVGQ